LPIDVDLAGDEQVLDARRPVISATSCAEGSHLDRMALRLGLAGSSVHEGSHVHARRAPGPFTLLDRANPLGECGSPPRPAGPLAREPRGSDVGGRREGDALAGSGGQEILARAENTGAHGGRSHRTRGGGQRRERRGRSVDDGVHGGADTSSGAAPGTRRVSCGRRRHHNERQPTPADDGHAGRADASSLTGPGTPCVRTHKGQARQTAGRCGRAAEGRESADSREVTEARW